MGPTASGKTDLAVALCDYLPVDIINVDSTQVYRGMDIGTAKPEASVLARAPHRLLDIRDPDEPYSVAQFVTDARQHINEITSAGRIPLLVGGTMLYFRGLLEGLADLPASDSQVREQIEEQARQHGWPHVHRLLMEVDAATAVKIHPHHSQRIGRALEVFRVGGIPLSELVARQHRGQGARPRLLDDYRVLQMALIPADRQLLHARIEQRFLAMLAAGLVDEVEALLAQGDLSADLPSMRAVGYRQVCAYLEGEYSYDELVQKGIAATRQLAKRQLTWLRRWPDVFCVNAEPADFGQSDDGALRELHSPDEILARALNFLEKAAIYFKPAR